MAKKMHKIYVNAGLPIAMFDCRRVQYGAPKPDVVFKSHQSNMSQTIVKNQQT